MNEINFSFIKMYGKKMLCEYQSRLFRSLYLGIVYIDYRSTATDLKPYFSSNEKLVNYRSAFLQQQIDPVHPFLPARFQILSLYIISAANNPLGCTLKGVWEVLSPEHSFPLSQNLPGFLPPLFVEREICPGESVSYSSNRHFMASELRLAHS